MATTQAPATNIKYSYDAMGNRISQVVTSGGTKYYTWYVRDAQGNIMSTYTDEVDNSGLDTLPLQLAQYFLYGSSRLGLFTVDDDNVDGEVGSTENYYVDRNFGYDRGHKEYELTNHLGNVLATISDRKFAVPSDTSSLIDHYEPHIVTAQDYYPFGMLSRVDLPGSGKSYKFGFNGQEMNNEVKGGLGNSYTAQFWEYDSRIGRRWNLDPKPMGGVSEYSTFANNPIFYFDHNGDSIPAKFWRRQDVKTNEMFEQVRKMFASEYGIEVGYNSESEMLYYKGDVATDLPVSASARKYIMDALTSTAGQRESRKKFGTLNIGYGLMTPVGADAGTGRSFQRNLYIDLGAYNEDGSWKNFEYSGVPARAQNLARTFEHEWIGHILLDKGDGAMRKWSYEPGETESIVNGFRREIGLSDFQSLNYGTESGPFRFFGNPSVLTGQDVKAQLNAVYITLYKDYYRILERGESAKPPAVPVNYIFKLPVKARNQ